jgi:hypothetical protein
MKTQFADVGAFLSKVQELDSLKADFVVPQGKMSMNCDGALLHIDGLDDFPIQEIMHEQIAAKLSIPKAYYDRMQAVDNLRAENVNAWFKQEPKTKRLVRTLDGEARALLSDRFRPLDNLLIAGAAMPVLAENPDLVVRSATITPARMYLQVSFPKIAGEIAVGDVIEYGFTLTTSEVGRGKVDVQDWFHQLRCSNGWVGESIFSKRHTGRRIGDDEEDYSLYADDTIQKELEAFQFRLRDLLKASVTPANFQTRMEKFRGAGKDTFKHSEAEEIVKNVTKKYSFSLDLMKSVFDRVMENTQPSRLAIADAVTFEAHETADADHAYLLEQTGYAIVAMNPSEWKEISA